MTVANIRDATPDDVDFIAWVMLTASRSQLDRGIWEYLNDYSEDEALDLLRRIAVTDVVHLFHHSLFVIVEIDGVPAAGMCGYDSETQGFEQYGAALGAVIAECPQHLDPEEMGRRGGVLLSGFPPPPPGRRFVVENVATRADFRRRGLVSLLLNYLFDRGRDRGFTDSQISVFIGNDPARAAYLKAGFDVAAEARSDGWAEEIGCPGTELMLRPL